MLSCWPQKWHCKTPKLPEDITGEKDTEPGTISPSLFSKTARLNAPATFVFRNINLCQSVLINLCKISSSLSFSLDFFVNLTEFLASFAQMMNPQVSTDSWMSSSTLPQDSNKVQVSCSSLIQRCWSRLDRRGEEIQVLWQLVVDWFRIAAFGMMVRRWFGELEVKSGYWYKFRGMQWSWLT